MDACDGSSGMGYPNEGSKPPNASDPFFSSGWDPISSLTQTQFQHYPYHPPIWENQVITTNSAELPHYQSETNFLGLQNFVDRGFPKMVGSSGTICNSPNYGEGTQVRASHSQECRNSEEGNGSPSNERRRKRSPESSSPYDPNKSNEGELVKNPPDDDSDVPKEQSEKKQRTESGSSRGKQGSKQVKEDSDSGDAPKDNYIHVRARRGQATNSHSLAERLRREKISERMRLLQELVPGCNKITGKAVMLDEIINYVQSLQQQVEFLSMKLATLIPDLSIDLERALAKEVVHSHGRDALVRGLGPGPIPYAQGIFQGSLPSVLSTSQYPPFPQVTGQLETELQTLCQTGFDSSSDMDFLKSNDSDGF